MRNSQRSHIQYLAEGDRNLLRHNEWSRPVGKNNQNDSSQPKGRQKLWILTANESSGIFLSPLWSIFDHKQPLPRLAEPPNIWNVGMFWDVLGMVIVAQSHFSPWTRPSMATLGSLGMPPSFLPPTLHVARQKWLFLRPRTAWMMPEVSPFISRSTKGPTEEENLSFASRYLLIILLKHWKCGLFSLFGILK